MNRIPPELDQLMWALAESPEPDALSEFEKRYPTHRAELGKRIAMVRGLKGARVTPTATPPLPRFETLDPTPTPRIPTYAYALGVLLLAAIGVGAFAVVQSTLNRDQFAAETPVARVEVLPTPTGFQPPAIPYTVSSETPAPVQTPPDPPAYVPPLERRVTLAAESIQFGDLLAMLASQSTVRLEVAPGMPNPTLNVRYTEWRVADILNDMGAKLGFTPFDQGDGVVLLIPARDRGESGSANANELAVEVRELPPGVQDSATGRREN